MRKLFSTRFGSHLYGTNTPTSDIDLKHVVLPTLNSLLRGEVPQTKVKKTNDKLNVKNTVNDVDEEFIPLQVFARDFLNGQTYALELAFAVDGVHAQQTLHEENFTELVHELRSKFLTSNVNALVGYAVNQASLYSFKGERLDVTTQVLDRLQEVVAQHGPLQRLSVAAGDATLTRLAIAHPKYFQLSTYDIGGDQQRPCFKLLEKTLPFTDTLDHALGVVKTLKAKYGDRAAAASVDNVDWKATMHALRIVHEGVELLSTQRLVLPLSQDKVDYLLKVKRGEVPLEEVREKLDAGLNEVKELAAASTLPKSGELKESFDQWLAVWLRELYL